jgi:predicted thioesterase
LLVGYMLTASTAHVIHQEGLTDFPVSAGYDKLRFLKPVMLGDTVTVTYTNVDRERGRSTAKVEVSNQKNGLSRAGAERASVAGGKERALVQSCLNGLLGNNSTSEAHRAGAITCDVPMRPASWP